MICNFPYDIHNLCLSVLPPQHDCKEEEEEVPTDLHQDQDSILDQEDPESPQIKKEEQGLCTGQDVEQLVLKQEAETYEGSEEQSLHLRIDESQCGAEDEPVKQPAESSVASQPNTITDTNPYTGKKSFPCDTCGKAFKCLSQLNMHLRIHTGEKPYSCTTCGKHFRFKNGLLVHVRIHTGEKPYSCTTCGNSFRSNGGLSVHMRTHTGEKPYSCETCGKSFTSSSGLLVHMRTHAGEKPYLCNSCGRRFCHLSNYKKHTRIHTGEKPYTCTICGKAFRLSNELTVHTGRAHTGEKPYHCRTCGKSYFDVCQLAKHTKSHTAK